MEYETQPDGALSLQQQKLVDSLSDDFIESIDKKILEISKPLGKKIALLVGTVMMDESLRIKGLPDIFYAQRVKYLVNQGHLLAEGDIDYMGYCEVRLP